MLRWNLCRAEAAYPTSAGPMRTCWNGGRPAGRPRDGRRLVAQVGGGGRDVEASQPPITLDRDLLGDYRAGHPLARVFPLLYEVVGRAAEDCDSVLAVAD